MKKTSNQTRSTYASNQTRSTNLVFKLVISNLMEDPKFEAVHLVILSKKKLFNHVGSFPQLNIACPYQS
jgi:hypothetical protein